MPSKRRIKTQKLNFIYSKKTVIIITTLSIFVLMIILFLTNNEMTIFQKALKIIGYTLITFITTFLFFYFAPKILRNLFDDEHFTILKYITITLILLILVSVGNTFFYISFFDFEKYDSILTIFIKHICNTLIIGIIPAVLVYFYGINNFLKENVHKLEKTTNKLNSHLIKTKLNFPEPKNELITIQGEGKSSIEIEINSILYIESVGNYAHIFQDNGDETARIRTTLLNIEEQLKKYQIFIRCHRAFIINTLKIKNFINEQSKLQLILENDSLIPVSRSYKSQIVTTIKV